MMSKWGLRLLRTLYVGLIACLPIAAFANYQAGQCSSSCVNFASTVVSAVHYAQLMLTDSTGADVSDTANHAIKVNVVAGGAGGGIVTNAGTFATQSNGFTSWAGGTLGAMANYGTAPAAILVPGVNAFITNANSNGQQAMAASSPVVIASNQSNLPVINGGSRYQAVAASQTATVLQSSAGATGDYLSHCVIYPASTSPGVVTVFDNTNTAANSAILFAGGATSTSNLTPISVPVGALSRNGSWQVTTGANVSVVCYGKFS